MKSLSKCLTLRDPMDYTLPGSSVHGIFQAKSTGVGCHCLLRTLFSTSPAPPLGAPRSVWPTASGWFLFPASRSLYPTYAQTELSQRLTGVPVEISRVLPLWNHLFAGLHPPSSWHSGFLGTPLSFFLTWLGSGNPCLCCRLKAASMQ